MVIDKETNEPVMIAKKYIVYIDQILEESNRQDGLVDISLIECVVVTIHEQLTFITSLIIQSDNTNLYQNPYLILGIHLLNIKMYSKIFISEYIHSETQDGKTILDAHFATTNRHLITFMKVWRENRITKVQTAAGLAFALSFNTGVRNTMVQLIDPDRNVLGELENKLTAIVKKMKEYYTRANHIFYQKLSDDDIVDVNTIVSDIKSLRFRVSLQSFSFIDEPIVFQVDIGQNTFKPVEENDQSNDSIDDILPTNNSVDILQKQINSVETTTNDFSIHHSKYNKRSMTQKHHDSIASLEGDVAITLNSEDNVQDSSDDESYNIDSDSSSSGDDDDDLSGVVNVTNVNLRE